PAPLPIELLESPAPGPAPRRKPLPSTDMKLPTSIVALRKTATSRLFCVERQVKEPPPVTKRLLSSRYGLDGYAMAPPLTVRSKGERYAIGVFVPCCPPLSTTNWPMIWVLALV